MRLGTEAKVGLVVFSALVVLIGVYWFLGGFGLRANSYPIYAIFPNAEKLDKGADVRMAGVKIGIVSEINLTRNSEARVELLIWNGNRIPSDSLSSITTGGFIGDNYIEIIPGASKTHLKSNQRLASKQIIRMEQILVQVNELMTELKKSASGINAVLGDKEIISTIKDTLKNLDKSAKTASEMIAAAKGIVGQSSPQIQKVFANLEMASGNAVALSAQLEEMVKTDARPNIAKIMKKTEMVMDNLNNSIIAAQQLFDMGKQGAAGLGNTLTKIDSIATQAEQMTGNLNKASVGIRDLATDPEIKCNLKATTANIAETTQQTKELITSLNKKYGKPACKKVINKAAIPDYGLTTNSLWNTAKGNYRFDANYTMAGANKSLYRLGAYNIGENTQLNLQAGKVLNDDDAIRYGLYASRIDVGYDRIIGPMILSFDLFRPDDPNLEARGIINITPEFGIYTGVLNAFDPDERDLMVGLRYFNTTSF